MNPMMVEVTRGGIVESEHRVHVAIASHDGIEIQGDGERLTFPRSAAKLMQALPLVESGAAHRAGLTPEQLASPAPVMAVNRTRQCSRGG